MVQSSLSVIIPNYNHSSYLPDILNSILDQSYKPLEIIVIDDGSTDNSIEVLESFAKKNKQIRLYQNDQNKGVIFTANRGLELTKGEYVCFIASDDEVMPCFFEKSISLLKIHPKAGLCSAKLKTIDENGKIICVVPVKSISDKECFMPPNETLKLLIRHGAWMAGPTVIYRRDACLEAGGLIPELYGFCDVFLDMVIALKHGACFIPTVLAAQRQLSSSYSANFRSNLEMLIRSYSHAAYLMQTRYAELFPPNFLKSWKDQQLYHARLSTTKRLQKQQISIMKSILKKEKFIDRIFFSGLHASMRIQFLALISYLFLRLGRRLWPVLERGLLTVFRRIETSVGFRRK